MKTVRAVECFDLLPPFQVLVANRTGVSLSSNHNHFRVTVEPLHLMTKDTKPVRAMIGMSE